MKINFSQVLKGKTIPKSSLYMVYGKPYHLIAETRHKVQSFLLTNKKIETKKFIIDNDFIIDELRTDLESFSLFSEEMVIILNILSTSIPKNLQEYLLSVDIPNNYKIIITKSDSNASFKKTKFFKQIIEKYCLIEIFPLKNEDLRMWLKIKLESNKIIFTDHALDILITKNEGDTASLSQEIYKMTLSKNNRLDDILINVDNSYIYSEFDLIDNLLALNQKKSVIILEYLRKIKTPEPYLLALLYNEIKKIVSVKFNLEPKPYIPYNKSNMYQLLSKKLAIEQIIELLKYCYNIDKSIKSSSHYDYIWNQFERLIFSFK